MVSFLDRLIRLGRPSDRALRAASLLFLVTACSFPGTVRPTVKIGLVAPFEGRYRYVGYDVIYAVELALHEANSNDGVAGYGVELVPYDDGADPNMAVEQARKLDVDPNVLGAIGHFREDTTYAALPTYAQAGLPVIVPGVLGAPPTTSDQLAHRLDRAIGPVADALLERASDLASDDEIVVVSRGGPLEEALQLRARQRMELGLPSVAPDAQGWETEILVRDPAILICDLDPLRAGEVVSELRRRGWSGQVLGGPELAARDFVAVAGDAAAGVRFVTPWPFPGDVSGGDAFASAYRQMSGGIEPGPLAIPAYRAAWILLDGLTQAASEDHPTRQAVAMALTDYERSGPLSGLTARSGREWVDLGLSWYTIGAEGEPERR